MKVPNPAPEQAPGAGWIQNTFSINSKLCDFPEPLIVNPVFSFESDADSDSSTCDSSAAASPLLPLNQRRPSAFLPVAPPQQPMAERKVVAIQSGS